MNNLKGNLLYLFALALTFTWTIGYYGHHFGGLFHLILLAAVVAAYISIWDIEKLKTPKQKIKLPGTYR